MKAGLRRRLFVSVTAISALTLVVLVVVFNLALRSSLSADADRLVEARAQAALEGLTVGGGRVGIRETSDEGAPDAQVWIYSGSRNVERPLVDPAIDALADSLAAKGSGTAEDPGSETRLFALPITDDEMIVGSVVAGVSLEPYERTATKALTGSVLLGLLVIALVGVISRLVVDRALRPVARMTRDAADWSEHDLDRRFNPSEPNDELSRLAATFDGMLDRMAAMVRHERNFSAELSHELRTPLASIAAEAEVALNRGRSEASYRHSMERIAIRSRELSEILETLLSVARAGATDFAGVSSDLDEVLISSIRSAQEIAENAGIEIRCSFNSSPIRVQGSPETLQRVLGPVIENACAYARTCVTVTSSRHPSPNVTVADDGPGVDPTEREEIFEPGRRGSATRNPEAGAGTGLGLPLSRRLARAIGGDVEAIITGETGGRIRVTLLSAPGSEARAGKT